MEAMEGWSGWGGWGLKIAHRDFSKTYDLLPHWKPFDKRSSYGTNPQGKATPGWTEAFLVGRRWGHGPGVQLYIATMSDNNGSVHQKPTYLQWLQHLRFPTFHFHSRQGGMWCKSASSPQVALDWMCFWQITISANWEDISGNYAALKQ